MLAIGGWKPIVAPYPPAFSDSFIGIELEEVHFRSTKWSGSNNAIFNNLKLIQPFLSPRSTAQLSTKYERQVPNNGPHNCGLLDEMSFFATRLSQLGKYDQLVLILGYERSNCFLLFCG